MAGVHISGLTALYARIIEKIVLKEMLPSGAKGHYFGLAHDIFWWEFLDQLAIAVDARGLVTDSKTQIWPSDEATAKSPVARYNLCNFYGTLGSYSLFMERHSSYS